MQGDPVAATVRFSNGSGKPRVPDFALDVHGMATKFYLPDGSRTDIVAVSSEAFPARTPDEFVAFMRAAKPIGGTELPGPRLLLFAATHPQSWPALAAGAKLRPIPSYAQCSYRAVHAFKWIDAGGGERFVRYRWLPAAGEASISRREAKARGAEYLQKEIADRLAREPARFALELQIAGPGDRVDDPTARWPASRETVVAGTLEVTGLETGRDTNGDVLVFDPTRITDGIELSDDPVLRFRTHAYSVSIERRSGVPRGAEAPKA
jgi:catalase